MCKETADDRDPTYDGSMPENAVFLSKKNVTSQKLVASITWMPVFAGMTSLRERAISVIPAQAGIQEVSAKSPLDQTKCLVDFRQHIVFTDHCLMQ